MAKSIPCTASPPRHRRRRRSLLHPSTAALTVFSSLVASTDGYPLACQSSPPDFLCPLIDYDDLDPALPGPSSIPTPTFKKQFRRAVPDTYSQGDDGRWRKISKWTFYGSTMCLCDNGTMTSAPGNISSSTAPSSTPDVRASLPTGWTLDTSSNHANTGLILSVSLVLACMITTFIVGCIYWKKNRKRRAEKDPEKYLRNKYGKDEDADFGVRTKSKLWAKASARWKDNVKHSARRRRNARLTSSSMSQLNGSSLYLSRPTSPIASVHSSPALSRSPTPTPSVIACVPPDPDTSQPSTSHPLHNLASDSLPSSPPAYQGSIPGSRSSTTTKTPLPPEVSLEPSIPQAISPLSHGDLTTRGDEGPHYTHPLHVAHVATDDKAVLQRMVIMGSEPPVEGGSHCIHGSAPILYDNDHEGAAQYAESHLQNSVEPSNMFPAPPEPLSSSKGKMVALEGYDYNDLNVEPPSEPSAPPFDAPEGSEPSAPPLDADTEFIELSAPAMDEYDDLGDANAPPVEDEGDGSSEQARTSFQDGSRSGERPQSDSLPRYHP